MTRRPRGVVLPVLVAWGLLLVSGAGAQSPDTLRIQASGLDPTPVPVVVDRGYAAASASWLEELGGIVEARGDAFRIRLPGGVEVEVVPGTPFLRWGGELRQLAHPPYRFAGQLHLPLQFYVDLLPGELPAHFGWEEEGRTLRALDQARAEAPAPPAAAAVELRADPRDGERGVASRVVVIDPGHGGGEAGARGPTGVMEKDVSLQISRALAHELRGDPTIEVRMTRDRDIEVPIWRRGEMATEWKGERAGVFVSIHANSLSDSPGVRGFETYFLSEARTEHERRVAAVENAPLRREGPEEDPSSRDPLLDGILRDLRNFDHQRWSSLLAREVQLELAAFHPGPDRGVKQGPFAVITNALMPAVLVEVGFLSNPDEERLLTRPEFQARTARAIASAIRRFLDRYPAGTTAAEAGAEDGDGDG